MNTLLLLFVLASTAVGAITAAWMLIQGHNGQAKRVGWGLLLWLGAYAALVAQASLRSTARFLEVGEAQALCGFYLDCHISATIAAVERHAGEATLTIRVSSDARRATIPYSLRATFAEGQPVILEGRLRPDGAAEHRIKVRLPSPKPLVLRIEESFWLDRWLEAILWDDEDSLGHGRTLFRVA